jgi:hypothetical protein
VYDILCGFAKRSALKQQVAATTELLNAELAKASEIEAENQVCTLPSARSSHTICIHKYTYTIPCLPLYSCTTITKILHLYIQTNPSLWLLHLFGLQARKVKGTAVVFNDTRQREYETIIARMNVSHSAGPWPSKATSSGPPRQSCLSTSHYF